MKHKLILVTPPAAEPVTLDEARLHLKLDTFDSPPAHPDDRLVEALITTARQHLDGAVAVGLENTGWLGRALITQTWDLLLPAFPARICVPQPPLQHINAIKYLDPAGVEQTLDPGDYVINPGEPAEILPAIGAAWPSTLDAGHGRRDVVRVRFTAGYEGSDSPEDPAANVPAPIKAAIKLMVEDLYANRGELVVGTSFVSTRAAETLLAPFRMLWA